MRFLALIVAALWLPAAAQAQFDLTVNPERLDGAGFPFVDDDQGINNTLEFDVDGPTIAARGQVQGNAGPDVVTIAWETNFPESASASRQAAAVSQKSQVLVTVLVDYDEGEDYFGAAAALKCKASAKLRDNEANDPDDPDNAQASLSCDLRSGWRELDDDDEPLTDGDPDQTDLDTIEAAFAGRKDVQADTRGGKLTIKFKGQAP